MEAEKTIGDLSARLRRAAVAPAMRLPLQLDRMDNLRVAEQQHEPERGRLTRGQLMMQLIQRNGPAVLDGGNNAPPQLPQNPQAPRRSPRTYISSTIPSAAKLTTPKAVNPFRYTAKNIASPCEVL